jgi:hypothetical protein
LKWKLTLVLVFALLLVVVLSVSFVKEAKADTAGNAGYFNMPKSGYVTSLSVTNVMAPFGGTLTVTLKDSSSTIIASGSGGGSWGDQTVTYSVTPVFVYAGSSYSITVDLSGTPPLSDIGAYSTYTPYYLITVNSAYDSPTSSAYVLQGADYAVSVTSPVSGTGVQEVCTGYSIDGGGLTAGTSYGFTNVQADHSITFSWQLQYQVTFGQSGLDSSAQGTIVTVNSVPVSYGSLPYSIWVNSGASVSFTYASPISSNSHAHQQFVLTGSVSSPQTITGPTSISDTYTLEYYEFPVTFSQSGLDSSAQGTIVTVAGVPVSYGSLPYIVWITSGAQVSFTYATTIPSSNSGEQFALSSGVSSPVTVNSPITISDSYVTQYYLTVSTPYASPLGQGWYNAGSTAYCSVTASVVSGGSGTQYVFNSWWSGSGSGSYSGSNISPSFTINGPITEIATWQTQYYLTVNGVYGSTTGSDWYNAGATASFNVTSPISGGSGVQIAFSSWTGSGTGSYTGSTQASSCTMNASISETVSWTTQYYLTVTSSYGTTSGSGWYNSSDTAYAGLNVGTASGGAGVQYAFLNWNVGGYNYAQSNAITMSGPATASAAWATQYYLTVQSAYSTVSGAGWYNVGALAYAHVATNIVTDGTGTHTLQGWGGGASGSGLTSNSISMTSPKTAVASWSTVSGGGGGTPSYSVTLSGPYLEDGTAAAGQTVSCSLTYANQTIYLFNMNSSVGTPENLTVTSTSPFVQLMWNASSTLNYTRVYRFITNVTSDDVHLFITNPNQPSFVYTFSVTDFYGMLSPYLETRVSPDGVNNYVVERADLSEGGTVTFVMTQYQMYSLSFVCTQGTYTQSFTASTLGTPGQYPVSLNVLSGNFPLSNATSVLTAEANRINGTSVLVIYIDPSGNTSWVYVQISHMQGVTQIVDYVVNSTGSAQNFLWMLGDSGINYLVNVQAYSGGQLYTWNLVAGTSYSGSNPFSGLLDFLGKSVGTLPQVQTGWPSGMTSFQIGQLVAACIIMLFLCIGSFRSTGTCCILSWIVAGVMLYLGWFGGGTAYASIPEFALAGFLSVFIAIQEGKEVTREV